MENLTDTLKKLGFSNQYIAFLEEEGSSTYQSIFEKSNAVEFEVSTSNDLNNLVIENSISPLNSFSFI